MCLVCFGWFALQWTSQATPLEKDLDFAKVILLLYLWQSWLWLQCDNTGKYCGTLQSNLDK